MRIFKFSAVLLVLIIGFVYQVVAQETKIKWFGHAAFSVTTPKGKVLLIDPWLTNPLNPEAKDGKDALAAVPRADYILITHGHRDHVGDAVEIAKKTGAVLICNPELAGNLVKLAGFPEKQASTGAIMGIGGEIQIADGEVTVAMTPAVHSSSVFNPKADASDAERAYGGNPAGFVLIIKNGPTIYHSGDTAYFKDMETIGEQYQIDLALLNIGGHFGMEPRMAAKAAKSVGAKLAIPHHFATFPGITEKSDGFAAELKTLKIPFYEMKPGDIISYRGKKMMKNGLAEIGGTKLYYEISGEGRPLVLVSGGSLDRRMWDEQSEVFARHFQVIRYDIRGIGKSGTPDKPFSHSEDLYLLLEFLGIKKAFVIGLSFGGAIAVDFTLEHPEKVSALIVAASALSNLKDEYMEGNDLLSRLAKEKGIAAAVRKILDDASFVNQENLSARQKLEMILTENRHIFESNFPLIRFWQPTQLSIAERLPTINVPTLIIVGNNDYPIIHEIAGNLKTGIKGAKKVVIADAGHMVNMDKPAEFNRAVIDFLKEH